MRKSKQLGVPMILAVWQRDSGTCQLCGLPVEPGQYSIDHKVPTSHGGANDFGNLQLAHRSCNSGRGNRKQEPAKQVRIRAWLRRQPTEEELRRNPNDLRQKRLKLTKSEQKERIELHGALIRRLRGARRSRLADWGILEHAEIAIAGMYNDKFYEPTPYMEALLKTTTPRECEKVQWNGQMVERGTAGNFFDRAG